MGLLDNFQVLENVTGVPSMSITKNGISFNKATVEKLQNPIYVRTLIDKVGRRFAIVPCNSIEEPGAREFYSSNRDVAYGVRWNNHDLRTTLETLMHWTLKQQGWRARGVYSEDDNALIFDLDSAEPIKGRGGLKEGGIVYDEDTPF